MKQGAGNFTLFFLSPLPTLSWPRCHTSAPDALLLASCRSSSLAWPWASHRLSTQEMSFGLRTHHLVTSMFQTTLIFSPMSQVFGGVPGKQWSLCVAPCVCTAKPRYEFRGTSWVLVGLHLHRCVFLKHDNLTE